MAVSQQLTDADLVRLMLAGDEETFMVLMRDGANFDAGRGSVAAYLYGIARNHVLRAFDRERALVRFDDEADEGGELPHENLVARPDPLGDLTRAESVEKLRQAVLALPAHYREVVVLCELHEMSYVEAAEALGCAVGTVRSRLHRARAMLAEKLRGRRETAREGGAEFGEGGSTPAPGQALRTARCYA